MKKKINTILIILFAFLIVSCANSGNNSSNYSSTIIVTDMIGEKLEIKKNPSKVACVSRTTYDLLIAFGLGDKIDGAYKSIYNNVWVETIYPKSVNEYQYNYEEGYETFISRNVDLVFAPEKYIADGLKDHGIKALNVSLYGNPTFDEYVYFFADLVTQIWDYDYVKTKANVWKNRVKEAIDTVIADTKKEVKEKSLFYVRGDKNKGIGYTDQAKAFTEYAYRIMGFDFVGARLDTNTPSSEEIVAENPDIFVIGGIYQNVLINTLETTEPYTKLNAVKNHEIYTIPVGLTMFEQLSAMTPIFFYDQANKLFPNSCSYDVKSMTKSTIKEYFGTELSDQQIEYMFEGKDSKGKYLA
ncbi:MAG: ABC transporter substrate-binding protein [Bacilli bacterium]|nr:ABC transporter substrate-binding protein [Bacilli bacterium]